MQLTAFPFYVSKSRQFRYQPRAEGVNWDLFSPHNAFMPFLIIKPANRLLISCVSVFNLDDQLVKYIQPAEFPYRMFSDGEQDYIFYYGQPVTNLNLACGKYYLEIEGHYSEVFTVSTDVSKFLKLSWRSTTDVGAIPYPANWRQTLYLDTDLHEPEYPTELEPGTDGYGSEVLTFGRVGKKFKFNTDYLPGYMLDALALLPLHDQVNIGEYENVKSISVQPVNYTFGLLATVDVEFLEEEVIRSGCKHLDLEEITQTDFSPIPGTCGTAPSTAPYWVPTGKKTCIQEEGKNTGYLDTEIKDLNPNSPSYGQISNFQTYDVGVCPLPIATVYQSAAIAGFVTRDNCAPGYTGGTVLFTVAKGAFTSTISQADADTQAEAYFTANKQSYANANAACELAEIQYRPQYDNNGCFNGRMEVVNWTNSMGIPETRQGTVEEYHRYNMYYNKYGGSCPILDPNDPL